MSTIRDDSLIRAAFASARELEPTDAEVAAVVARAREPRRPRFALPATGGWRRLAVPAVAAAALAASGYAAVPPLRAAIDDVASTFADYVAGNDRQPPGRPLRPGESAATAFIAGSGEPRVIAEAGGYQLQFVREDDGYVGFDLGGTGVGMGLGLDTLSGHAVYVLGPGAMKTADRNGHVPLFGVTAPQVESVELAYASGPPLRMRVDGGFVLLAEPARDPEAVIGYDALRDEVERVALDYIAWDTYLPGGG